MIQINRRIISFLIVILFGLLIYLVAWSSLFTVSGIQIVGTDQQSIRTASGISIGEKLARVEPRAVARELKKPLWVKEATISRNWLTGKVTIEITPRTPIGIFKGHYIDKSGTIFDIPGVSQLALPVVEGLSTADGLAAIALFTQLPADFRSKVHMVSAMNVDRFQLTIEEGKRTVSLMWGSDSEMDVKIKVFEALIALKENSKISTVDVSAPHAPIVK